MSIGLRIRELRNNEKLNQSDFASKIGVKQSPLSQMESGKILPSIETLSKIIRIFNISYSWLIDGEGEMYPQKQNVKEKPHFQSVAKSVAKSVVNQMYEKSHTLAEEEKTKSKENLTLSNGKEKGKEDSKKPNVKKTLPNESVAKSVALNVANEMCKKSNTLENTDTMQLQDLKEHLQDSKDHINTLKERVAALIKDKERLQQEKDNWEHRYNLAQAEIQQLKNVLPLGDTKAGVG